MPSRKKRNTKRNSHRTKNVTKRRRSKRGGAEPGQWNWPAMGAEGFGESGETPLPTGPLSECQSLECKKVKAQRAVEVAVAALEAITIELQDAREREKMQQLLVPLQMVATQLNTMVATGATSASQMLGDMSTSASQMGKSVGRRSLKRVRDLGVQAAHYGAKGIGAAARRQNKSYAPGSKQAIALQRMIESSNRFTGINQ